MKCRVAGQRFGRQEAVRSDPESGRKIPLTYFGRLSWGGEQQEPSQQQQQQQQPASSGVSHRAEGACVGAQQAPDNPTDERANDECQFQRPEISGSVRVFAEKSPPTTNQSRSESINQASGQSIQAMGARMQCKECV